MADHAAARTEGGTMIVILTMALAGYFTMLATAAIV